MSNWKNFVGPIRLEMKEAICFYFPYYEDSGVPVLFYRMANTIAQSYPSISVSIIDFENGSMWRNLLDLPNTSRIKFEKDLIVSPPINSVLVMQSLVPYYWPKELMLNDNQRILFWNLHPHNLIPSLLPLPYIRALPFNSFKIYKLLSSIYPSLIHNIKRFVNISLEHNGLFFMDKSNLDFTKKHLFLPIHNPSFIPIPLEPEMNSKQFFDLSVENTIKFGWVGRLCDFKFYILRYSFFELNKIADSFKGKKIEFHILGSGPFEDFLKSSALKCDSISFHFHNYIPHNEVDLFLKQNVDILMAMGTSALEGARIGIPTILLDPILCEPSGDYIFRLLYRTENYDLGHFIGKSDYSKNNASLFEIVSSLIDNYALYSERTYNYFIENHNIHNVKKIFLERINSTKLKFFMIKGFVLNKPVLLRLYNCLRGF